MLFFTQKGKCFLMRVYEIPPKEKAVKLLRGRAIPKFESIFENDEYGEKPSSVLRI